MHGIERERVHVNVAVHDVQCLHVHEVECLHVHEVECVHGHECVYVHVHGHVQLHICWQPRLAKQCCWGDQYITAQKLQVHFALDLPCKQLDCTHVHCVASNQY